MILSDRDIKARLATGELVIEPLADLDLQVQPASVDLRLSPTFVVYRLQRLACLDARDPHSVEGLTETIEIPEGEAFVLQPGAFALGSTVERVVIPDDLVARVEGRSSIGRLGVVVHATAGFIDPGFAGQITLEFSNLGQCPVKLYPGMRISQIVYQTMTSSAERPYGSKSRKSKYQDQRGPLASRIGHDAKTSDES